MNLTHVRFIGDLHGNSHIHRVYIKKVPYTFQIGDLGFDYTYLADVDAENHVAIAGNHENYNEVQNYKHFLGDFGVHTIPDFGDIFFVRGGFSIDHSLRVEGEDLFQEQEQISQAQGYKAIELYEQLKPKFVATHECPLSIVPHVTDGYVGKKFGYPEGIIPTRTNQILQTMLEIHKPKVWIFGHYHVKKWFNLEDVRYICINKNDYMDFPKNFIHEL